MHRFRDMLAAAALTSALAASAAAGGTIELAWEPVPGAAGYRLQVVPLGAGEMWTVDVDGTATAHALEVDDASGVRVCVRSRRGDGLISADCSNEVVGWAAPRIDAVSVSSTAVAPGGELLVELRLDGAGFHLDGGVDVGAPGVAVVAHERTSTTVADVTLALPASGTGLEAARLELFNRHPLDAACAPDGAGCPVAAVEIDLAVEAIVGGLFSVATNRATVGGTLFHQTPYRVPAPGEPPQAATPSFLPVGTGLIALELEPDGGLLFAVDRITTLGGGQPTLRPGALYRRDAAGAISLVHDFALDGPGLSSIAAAARDAAGGWLVVPTATTTLIRGGAPTTLVPSSIYAYDPANDTLVERFAGGPLGTGPLDAVGALDDGRLALSTAGHPFVWIEGAMLRLWGMNGYAVDPAGTSVETVLDGVALGLADLDALSLGSSASATVEIVEGAGGEGPEARPRLSTAGSGFAPWGQYHHQRIYETVAAGDALVAVGPNGLPGGIGLDALDDAGDGSFVFSVGPGGTVATGGGLLTLAPGVPYRLEPDGSIAPLGGPFAAALPLADIDALDVRPDGSIWFSTAADQWLAHGGSTLQLRHWRVHAWRPASGAIEVVLDLGARGVVDLDAVHGLADGRIVFSTASSPFVATPGGTLRLWDADAWVWDPATDSIEPWLRGTLLSIDGLDAITLAP